MFGAYSASLSTVSPAGVPIPALASSFGYNTLIWNWIPATDLSDIDQTHTGTTHPPSLNWAMTTKVPFGHTQNNQNITYDFGKSALAIGNSGDTTNACGISTFWQDVGTTTTWYGRGFDMTTGFFIEVGFSFDEFVAPNRSSFVPCPAISFYTFVGETAGGEFVEKDIAEFQSGGTGNVGYYQNTFDDDAPGGAYESGNGLVDRSAAGLGLLFSPTVFNKIQCLYVPTTDNSGNGIWRPAANGNVLTVAGSGGATTCTCYGR